MGSNTAESVAGPVDDTEMFTKLSDEVFQQYQKSQMTEEIDQLNTILALAIPEQKSAKTLATALGTIYTVQIAVQSVRPTVESTA